MLDRHSEDAIAFDVSIILYVCIAAMYNVHEAGDAIMAVLEADATTHAERGVQKTQCCISTSAWVPTIERMVNDPTPVILLKSKVCISCMKRKHTCNS